MRAGSGVGDESTCGVRTRLRGNGRGELADDDADDEERVELLVVLAITPVSSGRILST